MGNQFLDLLFQGVFEKLKEPFVCCHERPFLLCRRIGQVTVILRHGLFRFFYQPHKHRVLLLKFSLHYFLADFAIFMQECQFCTLFFGQPQFPFSAGTKKHSGAHPDSSSFPERTVYGALLGLLVKQPTLGLKLLEHLEHCVTIELSIWSLLLGGASGSEKSNGPSISNRRTTAACFVGRCFIDTIN